MVSHSCPEVPPTHVFITHSLCSSFWGTPAAAWQTLINTVLLRLCKRLQDGQTCTSQGSWAPPPVWRPGVVFQTSNLSGIKGQTAHLDIQTCFKQTNKQTNKNKLYEPSKSTSISCFFKKIYICMYVCMICWSHDLIIWFHDLISWSDHLVSWSDDLVSWSDDLVSWSDDLMIWSHDLMIYFTGFLQNLPAAL